MKNSTAHAGFSLIELLVAIVIGLLGSLAIMQIFVGSEAGKRAAGSLVDAQSGGLVALFAIERDLQQAGLGFTNLAALGCNVRSSGFFNNKPLQPVTIIPAGAAIGATSNLWDIPPGDANSDMIAIATGDSSVLVGGAQLSMTAAVGATAYRLSSVQGIRDNTHPDGGDYLLVGAPGFDCTLARAINVSAGGDVTVDFAAAAAYAEGSVVMHLGRRPQLLVYAVRNGALTRCDFLASNCSNDGLVGDTSVWVPVANDVVALVAQYGVDTGSPVDLAADAYCKSRLVAAGVCPNPDTGTSAPGNMSLAQPLRACDWARIPIVQLALVTRSGQFEREEISPETLTLWPTSAVAPTTTGPVWAVPDRRYRYSVTRGATALRNVIWMGPQSTC